LKFGGRSHEELDFYAEHGFLQEQKGRLHYSMQEGKLVVEWRIDAREDDVKSRTLPQGQEATEQINFGGSHVTTNEA
jgi:hypothetical protein